LYQPFHQQTTGHFFKQQPQMRRRCYDRLAAGSMQRMILNIIMVTSRNSGVCTTPLFYHPVHLRLKSTVVHLTSDSMERKTPNHGDELVVAAKLIL
jgi:hypothetical protein